MHSFIVGSRRRRDEHLPFIGFSLAGHCRREIITFPCRERLPSKGKRHFYDALSPVRQTFPPTLELEEERFVREAVAPRTEALFTDRRRSTSREYRKFVACFWSN